MLIDFSDAMLAHARRRCEQLAHVNLQQGSIETLRDVSCKIVVSFKRVRTS